MSLAACDQELTFLDHPLSFDFFHFPIAYTVFYDKSVGAIIRTATPLEIGKKWEKFFFVLNSTFSTL